MDIQKSKKRRTHLSLTEEEWILGKSLAATKGITFSGLLRELLIESFNSLPLKRKKVYRSFIKNKLGKDGVL